MPESPVPFAPDTLETIQRAFRVATDLRHDAVSLEHLLLAMTDEAQVRRILSACGVDVDVLRKQLDEVLIRAFTPVPSSSVEPEPTLGFDRVIQQAVVHVMDKRPGLPCGFGAGHDHVIKQGVESAHVQGHDVAGFQFFQNVDDDLPGEFNVH